MEARKSSSVSKKSIRLSPEREYFNQLRGKDVVVEFTDEWKALKGSLLWVDRFTFCVRVPKNLVIPKAGKDVVLYKHAVRSIYPA